MKVILNADLEKLGRKGDIVDVAPGYGRNYLIPQRLAIPATKGALKQAGSMQKATAERVRKEQAVFEELAVKVREARIEIPAKAGEEGQLFGSVTTGDVAEALAASLGGQFDRRKISMEPVKSLGTHTFKIALHPEVVAEGVVEVISDGTGPPAEAKEAAAPTESDPVVPVPAAADPEEAEKTGPEQAETPDS
ncbi:MAG TPA: 50S ribosomal protein L9 [Actinomycetota bacterium]|nr:50S ribosomal protein L9 [Actinomycetota bacterium]